MPHLPAHFSSRRLFSVSALCLGAALMAAPALALEVGACHSPTP